MSTRKRTREPDPPAAVAGPVRDPARGLGTSIFDDIASVS